MSKTTENIKILNTQYIGRSIRLEALDNLATLGTREAIIEIGKRARDPYEEQEIRTKALYYLGRKGR